VNLDYHDTMLNMIRNIRRLNIFTTAAIGVACVLFFAPGSTCAQNTASNYTAQGIASVPDGNISSARAMALTDAQQKIVLAALADQMSFEKLSNYFTTLQELFINRPDVYVQRFKILNETTLQDTHHISIAAFVENELLQRDLESIGVHSPTEKTTKILLMVAEALSPDTNYFSWWAADPSERILPIDIGKQMAFFFRERGVGLVDNGKISTLTLTPHAGSVFPGQEAVLTAARQAEADIVVLVKATLNQTAAQPNDAFTQVQCNLKAEILSVKKHASILQTATNALGMNFDQDSAAQDAVAKACSRLAETITDKVLVANTSKHAYSLRCTFPGARPESSAQDFFSLLRATLPEIVQINVHETEDISIRMADITSIVDSATLIQKAMYAKPGGYKLKLGVIEDTIINLTVIPPGSTNAESGQ